MAFQNGYYKKILISSKPRQVSKAIPILVQPLEMRLISESICPADKTLCL